jgi:hypothetical protein
VEPPQKKRVEPPGMTIAQEMPINKAFMHCQEIRGTTDIREKTDSKSGGGNIVLVRVRPGAPTISMT